MAIENYPWRGSNPRAGAAQEVDADAELVIGGEFVPMNGMKRFPCEVYDRYEGKVRVSVQAADEDGAREQAEIAAAEMGCRNVDEVIVGPEA